MTTITTVGFGDITAEYWMEELFMIMLMITGVISFSVIAGALSSVFSSLDEKETQYKELVNVLDNINKQYVVNPGLQEEIM